MRIGRRLTVALWLVVTPVLAAHAYLSAHRSIKTYVTDLKRETRAASQGLAPALENDIRAGEWDQVRDVLQRGSIEGTMSAIFHADGTLWYGPPEMPPELVSAARGFKPGLQARAAEFEHAEGGRSWLCELVPLNDHDGRIIGFLLVARDWSDIGDDLRAREIGSLAAALVMMAVVAATISFFVRRYVSRPLAELSRRVMRFSAEGDTERDPAKDEVNLLTEEFRRLDEQLTRARTDLLARHRRELQLERGLVRADRLATIGMLASGLAHEIGNPMGVIRARAEYLLNSQPSTPKARSGLQVIIAQIDRVSRIVRMLLDYARARESRQTRCDVRMIIEHALTLVETEAARRRVEIVKQLGAAPLPVRCDADQLQQVFVNLAMNALDAMTPDGGLLRVVAQSEQAAGNGRLNLVFEDSGPGVPAQHQERIFDPFFTTKEPGRGTGMGLAVSQSIMRDHGGEISLTNGPCGARFVVAIPLAESGGQGPDAGAELRT